MRNVPSRSLLRNFCAGNTLSRTMPFMSGTRHSTSPMPRSRIQLSKLSAALVSEESGIFYLRIGQIDRQDRPRNEFLDLGVVDDQRRREHHGIPYRPHDEIILETMVATAHPHGGILMEEGAGALVAGQLDGADQPDAADFSDQRVIGEAILQGGAQLLAL